MTDPSLLSDNDQSVPLDSDGTEPPAGPHASSPSRCRTWIWLLLVGVVIAAAAVAVVVVLPENRPPAEATGAGSLNFAEVVITDLVQEETFDGTLGSIEDDPIRTQLEGTITEIAEKGDTIRQGEALFAIDNQPVVLLHGTLPAFRDIAIGEEIITVSSSLNGTVTWVSEPGSVVEQGDVLYRVDGQPVVVLYGEEPAYRNLEIPEPNPDVASAQAALSSARANLTALTSPPSDQELQAASAHLTSARQSLQDLRALPDPAAVQAAGAQLSNAEAALRLAQAAYDPVSWRSDVGSLPESLQLQEATNDHAIAEAQYNQALQGASPGQIASAQAEVAQAQVNINSLQEGPDPDARAAAEAQVDHAQLTLDTLLSGTSPAGTGHDVLQLKEALIALGYDPAATMTLDGEFTPATQDVVKAWQEDIGADVDGAVDLGEVVFLPGPAQMLEVLATQGSQAGSVATIATGDPATGTDVLQLQEALIALGHDADGSLLADGFHTPEAIEAVLAFQAATGLELDGIIDLGEVVFLPGAVRVTSQLATSGSGVGAGAALLGVSLSDKVIRVDLPADNQGVLAVGDAVDVEMPDLTEIPATVILVSQTATPSANGPATFEVRIELDDPSAAVGLDEAPVDVVVVSDSVHDVMAIPVSALVALLEGGYAVEVDAGGGGTRLVAVEVGFFGSNNMIAITSEGLQPGDRVVVP